MLERRGRLRFLEEAAFPFRIGDEIGGQDLECHLAVQLGIDGAVDDAHAAAADFVEDLVVGKGPPDHRSPY